MIHWQPAFERTKPNICITMHIALDQGHFEIRSGDVGACKSNDRSNAQAFFLSGFPGIQHILPRFVRRERTMYMHGVDGPRILQLLGQEGARMLPHGNLAVEQSQDVASPKK